MFAIFCFELINKLLMSFVYNDAYRPLELLSLFVQRILVMMVI